jgi:hypothetical protein
LKIESETGACVSQAWRVEDESFLLFRAWRSMPPEQYGDPLRAESWHELCIDLTDRGIPLSAKDTMLVTLVAVLCNGQLCLEKVVTNSEQSGITMAACTVNAQSGIADWLAKGPYHEWTLQRYKCVVGQYTPKKEA